MVRLPMNPAMTSTRHHHILLRIADIVFSISGDVSTDVTSLGESYRDFVCTGEEPEVTIHARCDDLPQIPLRAEDRVFDSEGTWSLHRVGEQYVFVLKSPLFGPLPYRIGLFSADFRWGEIHNRIPSGFERRPGDLMINPLEFPLSEVLMVCLLAQGRGVMVHACGIDDGGRGYLFAGNSTHGKSTTARIWEDRAVVLNDDRIVLRRHEGRIYMHGTPWHGDFSRVAAGRVPLDKVFFLHHAEANQVRRREGVVASSMLMTRSFLPFWDERGMRFTLDFYAQLVGELPCYELGFVPDESTPDFVRSVG